MAFKTLEQIIDETVEFYSADPSRRAYDSVSKACLYNFEGKKCAFSRCCKEEIDLTTFEGKPADELINELGGEILKEEYQVAHADFWVDMQRLHDTQRYWSETGINEYGQEYVKKLKRRYC